MSRGGLARRLRDLVVILLLSPLSSCSSDGDTPCTSEQACPASACPDVSGQYRACLSCGGEPPRGPYVVRVVRGCGACAVQITVAGAGSSAEVRPGCASGAGNLIWNYEIDRTTAQCTGAVVGGTGDFTCTVGNAACAMTWRPPGTPCP